MSSTKRDSARIERRLVATLTEACEIAKAEITGFDWLTHEVDYQAFAQSLVVIWVFDTRANRELALSTGLDLRMRELTATALEDARVDLPSSDRYVRFDSEEECHLQHGGNWRLRLAKLYAVKGRSLG
ncbi:hypothetical protein [Pseudomonas yamanorum]|uniref:hypothetical protein n=1 Tax=Pseudomonas yamanorum TaxID=515393 RepID=UPI00087B5864|nr:hypothetical protein [Pseudomonas yamanorum]SDT99006.1 hypothetical protein SAMN05216237_1127 [Pseudomonas yamanorum]